jgi:hypothetical protein
MVKDIDFPVKDIPVAAKKAEAHFMNLIEVSKIFGAKFTLTEAYSIIGASLQG